LIVLLCLTNVFAFAQSKNDSMHQAKRKCYSPVGVSAEYAGGFGMLSAGVLFKPIKRTEFAVTLGYVPPEYGNIFTANTLISYKLVRIKLNKQFEVNLLKAGAFANFNFGKNIHLLWPRDQYPKGYYWWNSSLRYGPFLETELAFHPNHSKFNYTVFLQCLTNDFYIFTYLPNTRFISVTDIVVFGTGVKIFFKS